MTAPTAFEVGKFLAPADETPANSLMTHHNLTFSSPRDLKDFLKPLVANRRFRLQLIGCGAICSKDTCCSEKSSVFRIPNLQSPPRAFDATREKKRTYIWECPAFADLSEGLDAIEKTDFKKVCRVKAGKRHYVSIFLGRSRSKKYWPRLQIPVVTMRA